MLASFCVEKQLVITNTIFKHPKCRLYIWKSPADTPDRVVCNQIDFMCINKRYRNSVLAVKTYPGADVPTDHNILVGKIRLRLKRVARTNKQTVTIDRERMLNDTVKQEITSIYKQKIKLTSSKEESTEENWTIIKGILKTVQETKLSALKARKKQGWMTEEILRLRDQRREVRNKDKNEYKRIRAISRQKIRHPKTQFHSKECNEIEQYEKKHDTFHLHKKLKQVAGNKRKQVSQSLEYRNGHRILDINEQLKEWENYISELF
ncbi:uncharacterized protein [Diabrotica undecimpunctata]|uniref:uncharacterized protein n=1 Tax=Diabrotica undecimpunctata TaxID=50387 RepID=UPI003B63E33C